MKQPVSRNSFDRLRGYLGVYLQEGSPFVDAPWNEGADVQWSLLRDAIRDAGLEGTAGIELRIDPVLDGEHLAGFVARGGPGRFYCNGLPVLWPESRWINVHGLAQPATDRGRAGEGDDHWPRMIYLEAWVGTVDSLDLPDLDDPGLGAERGTFRTRVHSRIVVGHPHEHRTNLRLTIRGSYGADRNVVYRVELLHVRESCASLLWDSAAASVTALVTLRAEARATEVTLSRTDGFDVGSHVRFEGRGVRHGLYRVTGRTAETITIEGHDCHLVSLVDCTGVSVRDNGGVLEVIVEDDPLEDSALATLRRGSLVTELPANLGKPSPAGGWRVADVSRDQEAPPDHPDRRTVRVTLVPNGLTEALDPWDATRASSLAVHGHPFHTCIEVNTPADIETLQDWTPGMRVQIRINPETRHDGTALSFVETESAGRCKPGTEDVPADEVRRAVRIIFHQRGAGGEGKGPTMTLVLDEALSHEHEAGAMVVPERPIRARRYEGHACDVPIDVIDPSVKPSKAAPTSPYDLGGRLPLVPSGLSLLLSVEQQPDQEETRPVGVPGDGWTFAARAGGWVERPVFALIDEVQRGRTPLARLEWRDDGGLSVIDVRPVPAPHAHHGWLADIADTADEIAADVAGHQAERVAEMARRAGGQRAQRDLVREIGALADEVSAWANDNPGCARSCRILRAAVDAVVDSEIPTAAELSRIASAMERLACAVALACDAAEAKREQPAAPSKEPPVRSKEPPVPSKSPAEPPVLVPPEQPPVLVPPAQPPVLVPPEQPPVLVPPAQPPVPVPVPPEQPPVLVPPAQPPVLVLPAQPPVLVPPAQPPVLAQPPAEPPVLAPPAEPPVLAPPAEPPVLAPPAEPPVPPAEPPVSSKEPPVLAQPPAEPPVLVPPAEPPVLVPPAEPPVLVPPAEPPVPVPPEQPRWLVPPAEPPVLVPPAPLKAIAAVAEPALVTKIVDIGGLPTRLVDAPRAIAPDQRTKWPALRHVPAPGGLPRPERRLAEVVAVLLEQTAAIGRRARAGEDRAALQTALDVLWKTRFQVSQLEQPIRVEDAIAFHDSSSRAAKGKP